MLSLKLTLKALLALAGALSISLTYVVNNGTECYVYPESLAYFGQPVDDVPSILQALEPCRTNGSMVITNNTFNIDRILTWRGKKRGQRKRPG